MQRHNHHGIEWGELPRHPQRNDDWCVGRIGDLIVVEVHTIKKERDDSLDKEVANMITKYIIILSIYIMAFIHVSMALCVLFTAHNEMLFSFCRRLNPITSFKDHHTIFFLVMDEWIQVLWGKQWRKLDQEFLLIH